MKKGFITGTTTAAIIAACWIAGSEQLNTGMLWLFAGLIGWVFLVLWANRRKEI